MVVLLGEYQRRFKNKKIKTLKYEMWETVVAIRKPYEIILLCNNTQPIWTLKKNNCIIVH